jgi:HTH-type transcriptional regulator/antitoxin HigA
METKNERPVPYRAVHPGEILREELRERNIKQNAFAKQIGVQSTHLNEFIKGKRNLNAELAKKLEAALGISYSTWMEIQSGYLYDSEAIYNRKKEKAEEKDKEKQANEYLKKCSKNIAICKILEKLGIKSSSKSEQMEKLKSVFQFDLTQFDLSKMKIAGMYKHSQKVQIDQRNMNTWLLLNWLETNSSEISYLKQYTSGNAVVAAKKIAILANKGTLTAEKIKKILNDSGIGYVVVKKLDKTPIDAYSTFSQNHPVITVTYRINDLDKLAFDVLHELCHIDRHLNRGEESFISIDAEGYSSDPRENEANEFARNTLIPEETWNKILKAKADSISPYEVIRKVATAARSNGISPTIAVARYKHDTNWYNTADYRSPKILNP